MQHPVINKLFKRAVAEVSAPEIVQDAPDVTAKPVLPDNWQDLNATDMKALAEALTGFKTGTKAEAKAAIENHLNG